MNLYSKEIEEKILAHLMVYPSHYPKAASYLKPELFYFPFNQKLYETIFKINTTGGVADTVSIHYALKAEPDYEPAQITTLTHRHTYIANIEEKCLILNQLYFNRQLKEIGRELFEMADTEDGIELLEAATKKIENLWSILTHHKTTDLTKIIADAQAEITAAKETGVFGIKTYFNEIDDITLGRHGGDLVIIAGRPGHGKTTLALCEAYQVAQHLPVAIFSLEMPSVQLMKKIISRDSQIPLKTLRTGQTTEVQDEQLSQSIRTLMNFNDRIFMYDIASVHITDLSNIVKKLKRTRGIGVVYVDYIQLMAGNREKGTNREQEIGTISRGLKKLAMDLNICVVGLSQLNREVETRADKRPLLSDLRESGNIEQDADTVHFIVRHEKYGTQSITIKGQDKSTAGIAEIITAKNRNGDTGVSYLNFNGATSTVSNYQSEPF